MHSHVSFSGKQKVLDFVRFFRDHYRVTLSRPDSTKKCQILSDFFWNCPEVTLCRPSTRKRGFVVSKKVPSRRPRCAANVQRKICSATTPGRSLSFRAPKVNRFRTSRTN